MHIWRLNGNWVHSERLFLKCGNSCAGLLSLKSLIACMSEAVELICSICSVFWKPAVSAFMIPFPALHGSCSIMPFQLKILCEVPSSWSHCALQFGVQPHGHLSVSMFCSRLPSKVQNNISRFHHQLRVHRDALGCNFNTFGGAWLNMLTCPSSAGASKYGRIHLVETLQ